MEVQMATQSGTKVGTTTASYVEVVRFDTRGCGYTGKTRFILKNTGAVNSMHYKIDGYLSDPSGTIGLPVAIKAETSVAASATVDDATTIAQQYAAIIFSVKNNAGATTYQLDWLSI